MTGPEQSALTGSQSEAATIYLSAEKETILPTVQVRLKLPSGITAPVRAMCDTGSQVSVISKDAADRIGLTSKGSNIRLKATDGISNMKVKGLTRTEIANIFSDDVILELDILIVASLPHILPMR